MRRIAGALHRCLLRTRAGAPRGPGDACAVAGHLLSGRRRLPRVAAAIKGQEAENRRGGTGSSTLPGADGPAAAYPARLEAALQRSCPASRSKVISLAKPRQTPRKWRAAFAEGSGDRKAELVIWQTGTVDAMRGVDTDEFRRRSERRRDSCRRRSGRHPHEPAVQPAHRASSRPRPTPRHALGCTAATRCTCSTGWRSCGIGTNSELSISGCDQDTRHRRTSARLHRPAAGDLVIQRLRGQTGGEDAQGTRSLNELARAGVRLAGAAARAGRG